MGGFKDIEKMSIQELQDLKYKVEETLKEKKKSIRKRRPKDPDKRKPTLRIRSNKYLELYQKDMIGKTVCKYIGKVGVPSTEKKLRELTNNNEKIMEEYKEILKNL